jgi:hypothetical protein
MSHVDPRNRSRALCACICTCITNINVSCGPQEQVTGHGQMTPRARAQSLAPVTTRRYENYLTPKSMSVEKLVEKRPCDAKRQICDVTEQSAGNENCAGKCAGNEARSSKSHDHGACHAAQRPLEALWRPTWCMDGAKPQFFAVNGNGFPLIAQALARRYDQIPRKSLKFFTPWLPILLVCLQMERCTGFLVTGRCLQGVFRCTRHRRCFFGHVLTSSLLQKRNCAVDIRL